MWSHWYYVATILTSSESDNEPGEEEVVGQEESLDEDKMTANKPIDEDNSSD